MSTSDSSVLNLSFSSASRLLRALCCVRGDLDAAVVLVGAPEHAVAVARGADERQRQQEHDGADGARLALKEEAGQVEDLGKSGQRGLGTKIHGVGSSRSSGAPSNSVWL